MMLRFALLAAGSLALLMIAVRILIWQWRPHTRPCSFFGHDKRYVAIKTYNVVSLKDPTSDGKPLTCGHDHKIGDKGFYSARWACRRCPVLGEDCLGNAQDWKIYNEQIVPDVKKWANWSQPLPDPIEAARQKLKEVQARIADPAPITIKTEIVKKENYCSTCGWNHDGPCLPKTIDGPKGNNGPSGPDELRDCHCGATHTGPCVPGAIS